MFPPAKKKKKKSLLPVASGTLAASLHDKLPFNKFLFSVSPAGVVFYCLQLEYSLTHIFNKIIIIIADIY